MDAMIGLEVHCRLNTASKLFCSDSASSEGARPNAVTCPVCLGYPGYKPTVNRKAVEHVIAIGLALNCSIAEKALFARKTYFYPDMAKNYQITQYEMPIAHGGAVQLDGMRIRIRRAHLEEDPARISYPGGTVGGAYVLVDYNRAGAPLAEIVTEPDFPDAAHARRFLQRLATLLEYIGVYDSGSEAAMRVDANVSLHGGERVEIKNITGFEHVERALNHEIVRQRSIIRSGARIERETRRFDDASGTTMRMRTKESEEDYGYICDPDLPAIRISREQVGRIAAAMPELPDKRASRIASRYSISDSMAHLIVYHGRDFADFFEECAAQYSDYGRLANWAAIYLLKSLNWRGERVSESKVSADGFVELLVLIDSGSITERFAKELIKEYADTGIRPRALLANKRTRIGEEELARIVEETAAENERAVRELSSGSGKAMQYLIGKVLERTANQADPKLIRKILEERYASVAQ